MANKFEDFFLSLIPNQIFPILLVVQSNHSKITSRSLGGMSEHFVIRDKQTHKVNPDLTSHETSYFYIKSFTRSRMFHKTMRCFTRHWHISRFHFMEVIIESNLYYDFDYPCSKDVSLSVLWRPGSLIWLLSTATIDRPVLGHPMRAEPFAATGLEQPTRGPSTFYICLRVRLYKKKIKGQISAVN